MDRLVLRVWAWVDLRGQRPDAPGENPEGDYLEDM